MIPIDFFIELSKACTDRPFALLPEKQQQSYVLEIRKIVQKLKSRLEAKQLQQTHAYHIVQKMNQAVAGEYMDEPQFSEALAHLDELYGKRNSPEFLKKVKTLGTFAERFYRQAHEFYFLEERVREEATRLSSEEIQQNDMKTLQEIGSFYIWEYTLTVQQEMEKTDLKGKKELLKNGLQTTTGNLPGLKPLMKSFRQELAFHIYDLHRRWDILRIFFDFQSILETDDISQTMLGLSQFHADLLSIALKAGLANFKGLIYKPYPDDTALKDIIQDMMTAK